MLLRMQLSRGKVLDGLGMRDTTRQTIANFICVCNLHRYHSCIISLPLTVFTATISQSVLLKVDLVRRALYTTPNSPAMNSKLLLLNTIAMQRIRRLCR